MNCAIPQRYYDWRHGGIYSNGSNGIVMPVLVGRQAGRQVVFVCAVFLFFLFFPALYI